MEDSSLAKQIKGVYEAILDCAKREFLEKGYKDASLRTIAREANTSTGSIYTRFPVSYTHLGCGLITKTTPPTWRPTPM